MNTTTPGAPCPQASATARELARRLGEHQPPSNRHAVVLIGSRATGRQGPASDTDLIIVPTWTRWPGNGPADAAARAAARFQLNPARTHVTIHPNGTDIGICESWNTRAYDWCYLETQAHCCSWGPHADPEEHEGRTIIQKAPQGLIHRDLLAHNAVIFADSPGILADALPHVPAVPAGPWPQDPREGLLLHILDSSMTGATASGGYGRWDFPHRGKPKSKSLPETEVTILEEPPPETPAECSDAAASLAEDTAELLLTAGLFPQLQHTLLNRLNRIAALADAATAGILEQERLASLPGADDDNDLPF